jgi:hypothetical protein
MGRFPFVLAAFIALAACGEASAPGSPTDAEIRRAVLRFYAAPRGVLAQFDPNNMKYHQIVSTGGCQAIDSGFVCRVTFEREGEGKAMRFVWMTKEAEGWSVDIVTAEIPPDPVI